jgi:hypothetical protein
VRIQTETYGFAVQENCPLVHEPDFDFLDGFSDRFSTSNSLLSDQQEKRGDTVGHSISTRHDYDGPFASSRFLGFQRQHMQDAMFGTLGLANSIRGLF